MSTTAEIPAIKIQRTFNAPRERVWSAWTDPEQITKWFAGSCGGSLRKVEMDLRPGGAVAFHMDKEDETHLIHGTFREVNPPARLAFTWQVQGHPDFAETESLVIIDLLDRGGATEMRFTHEQLPTKELRDNHEDGWTGILDSLVDFIEG